jgi:hypothetical protein
MAGEHSDYLELSCKSKRLSFFYIGELGELVKVDERLRGGASAGGEEERERVVRDGCVAVTRSEEADVDPLLPAGWEIRRMRL